MNEKEKALKLIGTAGTIGAGPILKALERFLPGLAHFSGGAASAGYAADQILNFVKDKLETPAARRNENQLRSRAEQGIARSDEQASLSQMEQRQAFPNSIMGLGKLAAQAGGGLSAMREAAAKQAQENEFRQQELNQQAKAHEDLTQRQAQQDQLAAIDRQNKDIQRKEDSERKKAAEQRAVEIHQQRMNKASTSNASKNPIEIERQKRIKRALKLPLTRDQEETIEGLYDLANRFP